MTSNPIVIKYGGSLLDEPDHRRVFLKDIAILSKKQKVILVHGGGKEISRQMEKAGLKPKFVDGRRYTDEAAMVVVKKALSGLNAEIVVELTALGAQVTGGSGQDSHLVEAKAVPGLGRVGVPTTVNVQVLKKILDGDKMPVFYSIGEDEKREPLNINADDFALALAVACKAERLVYLTDTGGVLDTDGTPIELISPAGVEFLARRQAITGGMLVKARACVDALKQGVKSVDIVKGIQHLLESSKEPLQGTTFTMSEPNMNV